MLIHGCCTVVAADFECLSVLNGHETALDSFIEYVLVHVENSSLVTIK